MSGAFTSSGSNSEFLSLVGDNASITVRNPCRAIDDDVASISPVRGCAARNREAQFYTTGSNSEAISISGLSNRIVSGGSIETTGFQSEGISLSGGHNTLLRSDPITTSGDESEGISSQGSHAKLTVNGSVTTRGSNAEGISVSSQIGGHAQVIVSGSIATSGDDSEGVSVSSLLGGHDKLTLKGTITTFGNASEAVSVAGDSAMIELSNAIRTGGDDSPGIFVIGNDIVIDQGGPISTSGADSAGMRVVGANAKVAISASVISAQSDGVQLGGGADWLVVRDGKDRVVKCQYFGTPAKQYKGNCLNKKDNLAPSAAESDTKARYDEGARYDEEARYADYRENPKRHMRGTSLILSGGNGTAVQMGFGDDTVVLGPVEKLKVNGVIDGGDGTDTLVVKLRSLSRRDVALLPYGTSFTYGRVKIAFINFEDVILCRYPWDDPGNPLVCL